MKQHDSQHDRGCAAVILAAGKGTRMGSDLPKVLHLVAGKPMVHWVVEACRAAGASPIVLVVGHQSELVREAFSGEDDIVFVDQAPKQLGTGHAVEVCRDVLASLDGDAFVLAGDGPLIRCTTLATLLERHRNTHAAATLATSIINNPTGYGRIVRDANGLFVSITEHKNATEEERAIQEVYPSYACFDVQCLLESLAKLGRDPLSGEYYLTDVPAMMHGDGLKVEALTAVPAEDVLSINTPAQLAEVDTMLRGRLQMEATT